MSVQLASSKLENNPFSVCGLSNKYFRSHVKNIYSVNDWSKTDNQALFYNIELIDNAIEQKKTKNYDYRGEIEAYNKALKDRIGNDEHRTFRYFNEAFISAKKNAATHANENVNTDWLDDLWKEVKKYYQVFNEWYQDYRLYHYIG